MVLDQRPYEEKRDFIRVAVDCDVTLRDANGRCFTGAGKNLSAGGVLFHTDERLKPGDTLELHIEADRALLSVLDATIEVVRIEETDEALCYAVGSAIRSIHDD
jgi:hypothetical protein